MYSPATRPNQISRAVFIWLPLYVPERNAVPDTPMVSWFFEVLIEAPLVSAAAWFILAALQIYRDRWHTWTEAFFLFCCFFAGLYAIGDWLLFHSISGWYASLSALVSLTGLRSR